MYIIIDPKTNTVIDKGSSFVYVKRNEISGRLLRADLDDNATGIVTVEDSKYYNINRYLDNYVFVIDNLTYNSENENISDNNQIKDFTYIIPGYTKYDNSKTDYVYLYNDIEKIQENKQTENKEKFTEYLKANPYEYNGKKYGTTLEDQLEINLILSQAQSNSTVSWHATGEVNEEMSIADLTAIQAGIKEFIQEPYHKMQEYKKKIYDCNDIKELTAMTFEY